LENRWQTLGILTENGYYTIGITNEAGKVDINTTSELILRNLLLNLGLDLDKADIIVDSVMDWKDPDDLHRLHGAEDDYYISLPNPYKTKNANFETLEELLLVKGMTPEILLDEGKKGIIDFLTVNSR
jgi:general secretion pathway protein K